MEACTTGAVVDSPMSRPMGESERSECVHDRSTLLILYRAYFQTFTNLTQYWYFGTSLASPIFASVITLINEERTAAGKGPVGFVNPVLYEHPYVLNDVTNGSNPNCGSAGFQTAKGWDPVTGLGELTETQSLQE